MILVVSNCKENNKRVVANNNRKEAPIQNNFCSEIKALGKDQILCKAGTSETVVISKTRKNTGAYFFVELFSNNKLEGILKHTDSITNCPVDFFITYFKNSIEFTDLDHDGKKEITFLYEKVCRGGLEPSDLRLIKIEDKDIYIITGKRILKMDEKLVTDKHYLSANFSKAPKEFLDHAVKKWEDYLIEK